MTKPTLIYFAARGRAEVIRLLLAEAGIDYDEHHIGQGTPPANGRPTDFAALKASGILPFEAAPVWEDADGFRLAQSGAIVTYLARGAGLHGKTLREEALCDQALGAVDDVRIEARKLVTAAPEQRKAVREELTGKFIPRWLGFFERLFAANKSGYLVGDGLTVADLALWHLFELMQDNGLGAPLAQHPALLGFFERVKSRPRIAAYLASPRRPPLTKLPE